MRSPFGQAADFFGRAYVDQEQAALYQDSEDDRFESPSGYNLRLQSPTIGATPPSVVGDTTAEDNVDDYVRGMKEDLLASAREKRRPTNGDVAFRASGGINTAVKR